jgi:hypothetical protein
VKGATMIKKTKDRCHPRDEIYKYSTSVIDEKLKKRIEEHIYGRIISSSKDKDLGIEMDSHSGGGCRKCLKILAEIIETKKASKEGAEVLKHL